MTETKPRIVTANAMLPRIEIAMRHQYNAWLANIVAPDLFRFTTRHQQFYVKLCGDSAVVYSFCAAVALTPGTNSPVPGM